MNGRTLAAPSATPARAGVVPFRALRREARLLVRRRSAVLAVCALALVATVACAVGVAEQARQRQAIERFRALDGAERAQALAGSSDWGGAAYAAFHATWDAPAPLAFAAFGQRDVRPWMLRIRALALEGQIYETDVANPELARTGRLDLAFVVAFLAPLVLILLLHDLVAGEREAGRHGLLVISAGRPSRLWIPRIVVRLAAVLLALLLPFLGGAVAVRAPVGTSLLAAAAIAASVLLWAVPILWLAFRPRPAAAIAAEGVLLWACLALLIPGAGSMFIDARVDAVEGAEVSLVQREAVNDAWDLPVAVTYERFFASHPQWADSPYSEVGFQWKWYYAFQQVGDETAAPLAARYREALRERDALAGLLAWVSPAIAGQRWLQHLARTDTAATLRYEARIRAFHATLRRFYYPLLFRDLPYDPARFSELPDFARFAAEPAQP